MVKIIWTDPAIEALNSIHQYIAKDCFKINSFLKIKGCTPKDKSEK